MKKVCTILAALTLVVLCFVLMPAEAEAASASNLTFKLNSDGVSYYVYDCSTYASGALVIPSTYNGKAVTSIGSSAFYNCTSLTSITIPDSVTSIGNYAFKYCTGLTSVTIPDSVTSIGHDAFYKCTSLIYNEYGNALYLGNDLSPYIVLLKVSTTDITSIDIHSATKIICYNAFQYCTGLTSVTIPDSVTSIGSYAFSGCTGLTSVTIGDSVTSIGSYAFYNCTSFSGIQVDADNTNYSSDSQGVLYNKDKTLLIQAPGAIAACVIPDSVTRIGNRAFSRCTGLTSITIPDSVTSIGSDAFSGCTALTSVIIPDSVTRIGGGAFDSVKNVYITDIAAWCNISFECYDVIVMPPSDIYFTFYGNPLCYGADLYLNGVLVTDLVLPDGVTKISDYAFCNYEKLETIVLPSSVTNIGTNAFDGCSALAKVTYCGTASQWNKISIDSSNTYLKSAERIYHTSHIWVGGDCITRQTCSVCKADGDYSHVWIDATCTSKKYCFLCGITEGDYAHNWVAATCTTPKTCSDCGATEGDVYHAWINATCTNPKICSVCKITEGSALGHSWIDATCTVPKTCTTCGTTVGNALGHTYDGDRDFYCNVCNYCRLFSDANLTFYGTPGLSFQDYIGMQILVINSSVSDYDKVYAVALQQTPDGEVERVCNSYIYASNYTIFEHPIVSWSMSETVTVTLYAEKNGIIYQGVSFTTSVKELAMNKLPVYDAQDKTALCRILVDMLNYGAAVQATYGYNVENLPNADLGEYAKYGTTTTPEMSDVNDITGSGSVKVYRDNISLQDKVEFQFLVKTSALSDKTVKATVGGEEVDVAYTESGSYTIIRVAAKAAHMRDTYTIGIYDADGNAAAPVYNVSVEGYAKDQISSSRADVLIAMMRYGDSVALIA